MRRAIRLAGPSARGSTPRVTASGPAVRAGAEVGSHGSVSTAANNLASTTELRRAARARPFMRSTALAIIRAPVRTMALRRAAARVS